LIFGFYLVFDLYENNLDLLGKIIDGNIPKFI